MSDVESSHSAEIDGVFTGLPSALITGSMASEESQSISKGLGPSQKGYSTDAISVAIARDVLRRVRNGELPASSQQNKQLKT